jgi:NAD+ kinase
MSGIKRVVLVAKPGASENLRIANDISAWLEERGIDVFFNTEYELPGDADLAVVAGGDGTLLSVARDAAPLGIPILGINLGSLGFLTELQPDEVFSELETVLEGKYHIEERQALRLRHLRKGAVQEEYALLNDAVISKSALARMITIELRINQERVATYTSDGLIISTPTGSTAYNLSAGGPILDPSMRAFVITPICPHTMTYRPLVVPASVQVEASLLNTQEEVYLTLDGQIGIPLEHDDSLAVDLHPSPVRLVRVANRGFFEVLRRKLRWGER